MNQPKTALALLFLFAPALLASCSSSQKHVGGAVSQGKLFPDGTYEHKVTILIAAKEGVAERKIELTGVVQLKADAIHVVGLSYFGTTAFKIDENRATGEIKTEVFIDQMKKYEAHLKEFYLLLREVLLAQGHPQFIRTGNKATPIEVRLSGFDQNGIPAEFAIENSNFSVKVRVTGYEI